ncbi:MAG: Transcription antitermination protein nusG [Candidatus Shapirobacteria bacterium GW2011_GWE1_38_10]|uniref:Transcription termination/antitermination protein NusG n=1 Tax=Candidatus Shapirobacteria bacterium GW2011_GWE1_38_10 TaxID=1618488 RepID=A0A0G0IIK4_9BACT|nr:MAG: Transcription antitermination protein nusG [Candidatus Shapirobacteria bacterium GW2011_GWF2_37_20]KKQ50840.1 MAG: Transcription antitermination protein nusG [Candidatus Shapirobacteria bacterium GW2011_GWE1_38_10]KKQ64861.1 MAG: Transcription antitermination protein nusG [Candidatus Shapirobacteria bacterium GW2011_GWF1_38_23]HBP51053.1 transcription termination/antitermination protein NusG [Candidatus Shapirobacteria bacterium]
MPNNSTKTNQKEFQFTLSTNTPPIDAAWYVINTYSGHEYKVIDALKIRIKTMGLEDQIFQAIVPIQSKMIIRRGTKVKTQEKTFPGYVLIQMVVNDDSWVTVRTTQGVTGFVGIGSKPTPISQAEVDNIVKTTKEDKPKFQTPYSIGDVIKITNGPFADFIGTIDSIDQEKGKLRVLVSFFERETPVELDFLQVSKEL